jgi:hypothetical protein
MYKVLINPIIQSKIRVISHEQTPNRDNTNFVAFKASILDSTMALLSSHKNRNFCEMGSTSLFRREGYECMPAQFGSLVEMLSHILG